MTVSSMWDGFLKTRTENYKMYEEYLKQLKTLLSVEYNCSPGDFDRDVNILTVSALNEGRRQYSSERPFFSMATLGGNTVMTADEVLQPFLTGYMKSKLGHWLFEIPNILPINDELKKFGYRLSQTHHMFLPCKNTDADKGLPVKWYYDREIDRFYGDERFPNAICPQYLPERPDRIAVCAYDGEEIAAMAGCSQDAPHWQQIGIDVLPGYRSRGIGTYLVTLLKNKIIERGDIPFYGTAVANYHSQNIALNCGFKPVWVEIGAEKLK